MEENKTLTPSEYFEKIKAMKQKMTDRELDDIYDNCLAFLDKCKKTGQAEAAKKVEFFLEVVNKEHQLVKNGIDTYVYLEDIEEYIDNVASDVVKIIDLESFEREIPDELVEKIEKTKGIFQKYYVVFTDYTGKVERKVEKKRREKDPILFGSFENRDTRVVMERFYFLGDWVDEYCDLTLEKMVKAMKRKKNIVNKIEIPERYVAK